MIEYDKLPTFSASGTVTMANNATDVLAISGSATTNIYVLKMGFFINGGSAPGIVSIVKRSTANVGGTRTNVTSTRFNLGAPNTTVTSKLYTVNATTLGNLVGTLWSSYVTLGASANAELITTIIDFQSELGSPVALLSTSEELDLNFNGVSVGGSRFISSFILYCEGPKT